LPVQARELQRSIFSDARTLAVGLVVQFLPALNTTAALLHIPKDQDRMAQASIAQEITDMAELAAAAQVVVAAAAQDSIPETVVTVETAWLLLAGEITLL